MATISVVMDSEDARRLVVLVDEHIKSLDERIQERLEEGDEVPAKMKMGLDRLYADKAVYTNIVAAMRNALLDLYGAYKATRGRDV